MQSVWGADAPIRAEDFPGEKPLRERFVQCRCGAASFLPLPCRVCGEQNSKPVLAQTARYAASQRAKRWGLAVPIVLVASGLAWLAWWPLAFVPAAAALVLLVMELATRDAGAEECFWLFRQKTGWGGRKLTALAEPAMLDRITDAYDGDLRRLERMLAQEDSQGRAEEVFRLAQGLAGVYHNRRLAALLLRCLMRLPVSDGASLELDRICAWLEPDDLPGPEGLQRLADCARLTCLGVGEPTARFAARMCAARVERYVQNNEGKYLEMTVREACDADCAAVLRAALTPEEQAAVTLLWDCATIGAPEPVKEEEADPTPEDDTVLKELPATSSAVSSYWFRQVWYEKTSVQRAALMAMAQEEHGPLATLLRDSWGVGAAGTEGA